jgi:hypothetical protein
MLNWPLDPRSERRTYPGMKQFWILLTLCAALLALPAAASAQSTVPPPGGDNFSDAIRVSPANSQFLPLSPGVLGFSADTSTYTTEPGEFDACGSSTYGKTVWGFFAVDRTGRIDVTAAGYDSVLALLPVSQNGTPLSGPCTDRLAGRIESFPRDNLPTVKKGGVYAVQVGGFRDQAGNFASGPVEVDFELLPPEQLIADSGLAWRETSGGVKVTSVRVDGPTGSQAVVQCLRKSCGKKLTVKNPKPTARALRATAKPTAKPTGLKSTAAKASDAPVRFATKNVLRGRKIPNGARLVVYVESSNDDQIGQVFYWDIKGNAAGAKQIGCLEPGSRRIQRLGSCDGK